MKYLLKLAIMSAFTGILVNALLRKSRKSSMSRIPTLRPVRDAAPNLPEPLDGDDLRVAQNSPL